MYIYISIFPIPFLDNITLMKKIVRTVLQMHYHLKKKYLPYRTMDNFKQIAVYKYLDIDEQVYVRMKSS